MEIDVKCVAECNRVQRQMVSVLVAALFQLFLCTEPLDLNALLAAGKQALRNEQRARGGADQSFAVGGRQDEDRRGRGRGRGRSGRGRGRGGGDSDDGGGGRVLLSAEDAESFRGRKSRFMTSSKGNAQRAEAAAGELIVLSASSGGSASAAPHAASIGTVPSSSGPQAAARSSLDELIASVRAPSVAAASASAAVHADSEDAEADDGEHGRGRRGRRGRGRGRGRDGREGKGVGKLMMQHPPKDKDKDKDKEEPADKRETHQRPQAAAPSRPAEAWTAPTAASDGEKDKDKEEGDEERPSGKVYTGYLGYTLANIRPGPRAKVAGKARVLCVGEKPSIAQTIAEVLSRGHMSTRKGRATNVHGTLPLSVCVGHRLSIRV